MSLRLLLALTLALALTGQSPANWFGGAKPQEPAGPQTLTVMTWEDYLDPELVAKFEKEAKAKIEWVYFADDSDRNAKLKDEGTQGIDLVLVGDKEFGLYRKRGWLSKLDPKLAPNLKQIDPRAFERFPDALGYGVPYFWGTTGIVYRKDLVKEPITRWMDLFVPAAELQGRIQMQSDPRELTAMALIALGHSPNTHDAPAYEDVNKLLLKQKPFVHDYGSVSLEADSPLVTGDLVVAPAFNGDALTLQEFQENLEYVVPEEGGGFWMDFFVVMRLAKQPALAHRFLDFINTPANAAKNAQSLNYATPNKGALALLPQEFRDNPAVFPDEATLARCHPIETLPSWVKRQMENVAADVLPTPEE
jgi:spermidine/putrescine transport system substrate-binding protein